MKVKVALVKVLKRHSVTTSRILAENINFTHSRVIIMLEKNNIRCTGPFDFVIDL